MSASPEADAALATGLLPPYAHSLGMEVERMENGTPVLMFDFSERIRGRPTFVHGGALGGLLEMASMAALGCVLRQSGALPPLKPVNLTVEFLRGAGEQRTFAHARVIRTGRRLANLRAEAWQEDRGKPVAAAWMNVRLGSPR